MATQGVYIQLANLDVVLGQYRALPAEIEQAAGEGVYQAANYVMSLSQLEVPVRTGTLKRSGKVSLPRKEGDDVVCDLSYGSPGAESYAFIVHEGLHFRHASPTKARFLADPLNRSGPAVQGIIGDAIARRLGP